MPFQGSGYGNAILTKVENDIADAETIPLPAQPGQEPRALAIGEFKPWGEGKPSVPFGGTHLCHQSAETRLAQVHQVNEHLLSSPRQFYILAGDFNFTPDSVPYKAMIDANWVDTATALGNAKPTYSAAEPMMHIDYVFVQPASLWRVIDAQVLDEPVASDHAPVFVELEYVWP
ncbi:MAG: endonuclease/exonuclease/phosphatase family protein [Phycisphaeraceae bacterium]|nr:endonuclease/exonuclease/phosphatase family protein [Phycisphaeraceae bacterium]